MLRFILFQGMTFFKVLVLVLLNNNNPGSGAFILFDFLCEKIINREDNQKLNIYFKKYNYVI